MLHLISIKDITPDLILIFVIVISLRENKSTATLIGFFSGLIQDMFTTSFFGLSAMTKSIIGFWGVFFQPRKKNYNLSFFIAVVAILVFCHEIIYWLVFNLGNHSSFFRFVLHYMIPKWLYTLLCAVITYLIFKTILWKKESLAI